MPCRMGSREKLHGSPGDLVSDHCWSCMASLLHPLLASLPDALLPPVEWRPYWSGWELLTHFDTRIQELLCVGAECMQRITRPSFVGLLAEAWLPQGQSSQLHLLLRLSVAFIYTSIFLAVLVCHWLPTKYEEPNSHWCSTHNRKSEGGKHSVIWPTGRWAYRRERRFLFLYAKNWFTLL